MANEKPIIFSSEMVRAILDGRKTKTRRTGGLGAINDKPEIWTFLEQIENEYHFGHGDPNGDAWGEGFVKCPYGKVGDRLWVRETWKVNTWASRYVDIWYPANKKCERHPTERAGYFCLRLDAEQEKWESTKNKKHSPYRTRPSIFMFRWAARIWLEITGIRVERVQEITPQDAAKEGVIRKETTICNLTVDMFQRLWDSINAKRGYGWEKNPWVWVIEFKRVQEMPNG